MRQKSGPGPWLTFGLDLLTGDRGGGLSQWLPWLMRHNDLQLVPLPLSCHSGQASFQVDAMWPAPQGPNATLSPSEGATGQGWGARTHPPTAGAACRGQEAC